MPAFNYVKIGKRLCKIMELKDLSTVDVALAMTLPGANSQKHKENMISKLRRGNRCSHTILEALPNALGCNSDYLLYGTAEPTYGDMIDCLGDGKLPLPITLNLEIPLAAWLMSNPAPIVPSRLNGAKYFRALIAVVREAINIAYDEGCQQRIRNLNVGYDIRHVLIFMEMLQLCPENDNPSAAGTGDQREGQGASSGRFRITELRKVLLRPPPMGLRAKQTSVQRDKLAAKATQRKIRRLMVKP